MGQVSVRSSDTLAEEWLHGVEFCVDGIIHGQRFCAVTNEKAKVSYRAAHVEDGAIFSPPTRRGVEKLLAEFVERGIRALGLDQWAFHAEVRLTKDGPRFIELNARPAGGLLWRMSAARLGIDQFEFTARSLLDIPTTVREDRYFEEQAIYTTDTVRPLSLEFERPPGVFLEGAMGAPPGTAPVKNQENYEAFILGSGRDRKVVHAAMEDAVAKFAPSSLRSRER